MNPSLKSLALLSGPPHLTSLLIKLRTAWVLIFPKLSKPSPWNPYTSLQVKQVSTFSDQAAKHYSAHTLWLPFLPSTQHQLNQLLMYSLLPIFYPGEYKLHYSGTFTFWFSRITSWWCIQPAIWLILNNKNTYLCGKHHTRQQFYYK